MKKEKGSHLVTFRPGEVIGAYNQGEDILKDICGKLGGFGCKIFEPYILYTRLADFGFLIRDEEPLSNGYWSVSFFYPAGEDENMLRRIIIDAILNEAKNDPALFDKGYAVIIDVEGNQSLRSIRKSNKNNKTF